jgi:CRISPR/Cas system-associated endonuclease Cas1
MNSRYFLVFSALDPQGLMIQGAELLSLYFQALGHAGQQGFQRLELTEDYLNSALSLVNYMILQ